MSTKRAYRFKLISYLTEERIIEKLKHKQISHWAYAKHDKDVNAETGELKEPHYHILVTTNTPNSIKAIRDKFEDDSGQNTLARFIDDIKEDYEYLWHKNEDNKYKYDKSIVKVDSVAFWEQESEEETEKNEEFVNDLLSENYDRIKMAKKYGRDYIKNLKNYEYFRHQVIFDKNKEDAKEEYMQVKNAREEMTRAIDKTNDWERFKAMHP